MKKLIALAIFFAAGVAQATVMTCTLSEGIGPKTHKVTQIEHVSDGGTHSLTHFDIGYATGFVATVGTQGVVNITLKENSQTVSFHGALVDGAAFGGTVQGPDFNNYWITTTCQ